MIGETPEIVDSVENGLIFELAEQGKTKSAIARMLPRKGFTRRNGKVWARRQVGAVLAREAFYRQGAIRSGEANGRNQRLALLDAQAVDQPDGPWPP